jgi:YGGT family
MQPVEPVAPMEAIPPAHYARPVQPVEPVVPVEPIQPIQPVQPVQPVVPVQPVLIPPGYRTRQIVYLILGILEVLLAIRLLLKLLDANPDAGFSSLIYGLTWPFVALFEGVFPEPGGHGSVLELSTVLAMIVYALLAWGIVRVIEISRRRQTMYRA